MRKGGQRDEKKRRSYIEAIVELLKTKELGNLLEEDLDEDTLRRVGLLLVQVEVLEDGPGNRDVLR